MIQIQTGHTPNLIILPSQNSIRRTTYRFMPREHALPQCIISRRVAYIRGLVVGRGLFRGFEGFL